MKKLLLILVSMVALTATAQTKGKFEAYNYNGFRLHVYYTNDAMGDASYIVEGRDSLVTLEEPLFKDNVAEFGQYLSNIGKPVAARIFDYHLGGTGANPIVMTEGMGKFTKEGAYAGMMNNFQKSFGDAMADLPTGSVTEVPFGSSQVFAGVSFKFGHGASSDFPAAAILIGNTVCLTHWAPSRSHINNLYASSAEAVDARIAEMKQSLDTGAELFAGSHGGVVKRADAQFRLKYLQNVRQLLNDKNTAADFAAALKKAYPELKESEGGVDALAEALYRK